MNPKSHSHLPACLLCKNGDIVHYLELPDRFNLGRGSYHLYECRSCGLIFLYPQIPEDKIGVHYSAENYDPFLETSDSAALTQKIYARVKPWALNFKAKVITKSHALPGKILDVGAGTGSFLKAMSVRGWDVTGVEKDPSASAYGREKLRLNIITGDLADIDFPPQSFDVVTFWHSLEHIHRLRENLTVVRNIAGSASRLYIALPNLTSLDAGVYKSRWAPYDAPRHLWHFRPEVLADLLKEYGFQLEKTIPMPLDPFYNSLLSEGMTTSGSNILGMALRFPAVSSASFIHGYINPRKASSVIYSFLKL